MPSLTKADELILSRNLTGKCYGRYLQELSEEQYEDNHKVTVA